MINVIFDEEVRNKIQSGVDQLANAVKVTLGPKGQNVIIERLGQDPQVTKDGVTVAKEFELEDPLENMGATLVKRVAEKAGDISGDGTTTATVLTQAILKGGLKLVSAGHNPLDIKNGIDKAVESIVRHLNEESIDITVDSDMLEEIASLSANNDKEIGSIVAQTFQKVGIAGAVTVEEGQGHDTTVDIVDGMQFDRGMLSTHFSSNPDKMEIMLEHPYIMVIEGKLSAVDHVMPMLEVVVKAGRALVIIAEDITGQALSTLVMNKVRGGLSVSACKAPSFGTRRTEITKDIAALVGATVITAEDVIEANTDVLGQADSITMTQASTVIVGGKGQYIAERIGVIKDEIVEHTTEFEKEKIEGRIAKLSGGVGIIYVGGKSEVEMKEKKDRVDDAKEAVTSALEEGIIVGGGMALINAAEKSQIDNLVGDEIYGVDLVLRACQEPLRVIAENAGQDGAIVYNEVMCRGEFMFDGKNYNYGYDAKNHSYCDLVYKGIIDPKKVTRVALESAASVAGTILTTKCALVQKRL